MSQLEAGGKSHFPFISTLPYLRRKGEEREALESRNLRAASPPACSMWGRGGGGVGGPEGRKSCCK